MSPLTIKSFEDASLALRQNDLRQALYDEGAVLMAKVLVNLHGEEHRLRRNLESKVFRRDFFHFYEHEVFPQTLSETLAPFLAQGRMDLVDFGYRIMANLTADFTGIDRPNKSPEETATLLALLRTFGLAATLAHSKQDREAIKGRVREALSAFDRLYYEPSAARRRALLEAVASGHAREEDLPRDVLTVLLQNEDAIELTRDVLLKEIAFFALAGAHTSIHTLSHAMHEILTWCAANPDDRRQIAADPLFLQRCVHESMRLHPSSPIAARRALCPLSLGKSGAADAGEDVVIDLWSANRDPLVFGADAARFNPHREIPKTQNPYGLSFGLGMHACIGRNLAAGVVPKGAVDIADHHFGTVALIVRTLLDHGAATDPADPPARDETTARIMWARYPLLLSRP